MSTALIRKTVPALIGLLLVVFWFATPPAGKATVEEAFGATTIEAPPPPEACVYSAGPPPAALMRVVEQQRSFYRLSLQRVIVCKTKDRLPPDFSARRFGNDSGRRWLPLYVGCCSYQVRRHVVVEVVAPDDAGFIVVQAALVQGRWDYLKRNWRKIL